MYVHLLQTIQIKLNILIGLNKMKLLINIILMFCLVYPTRLFSQEVVYLEKGQVTPFTGYLFTPAKEQQLRLLSIEYKLLSEELIIKDKLISKLKLELEYSDLIVGKERDKADMWRKYAEESASKYINYNDSRETRDYIFFGLGILTTIAAAYVVSQVK